MEHTLQGLVFKIENIYQENGGDLENNKLRREARQKILNYFLDEFDNDFEGFKKDLRLLYLENYLQHWLDDEVIFSEDEDIEDILEDEEQVSKIDFLKEYLEDIKCYFSLPKEVFKDSLLKDCILEDFIDNILIAYENWDIEYYDYTNLELSLKEEDIKELILELHPDFSLEEKNMMVFNHDTKICELFRDYRFNHPCEYLLNFICVYPLVHDHKRFAEYVGIKFDEISKENKEFYRQVLSILLQYFYQRKVSEAQEFDAQISMKYGQRILQEEDIDIMAELIKNPSLDSILRDDKMYIYHYALFNNLLFYQPGMCDEYFKSMNKDTEEVIKKLRF